MKKIFLVTALFLLLISGISYSQSFSDFTVQDINGDDVTLSKLLDKGPVMVSFWATWCTPCKEELKKMQPVYEKYKDKGFTYFAISIDDQKTIAKVPALINAQGYTFPVGYDSDKKVFEAYGGTENDVPYFIIISKSKNIIKSHLGFKTGDEVGIEEDIKAALDIK